MADETLGDSLRLAATNTGIAEATIVSEKPRLQLNRRQKVFTRGFILKI